MELLFGALGMVLGGLVSFVVTRQLDKARIRDKNREEQEKFSKVISFMQPFIKTLRTDLERNNWECFEFYIKDQFKSFGPTNVHYKYLESDFKNIYAYVDVLVDYKFLAVKPGFNSTRIYRLEISFIELLKNWQTEKTKISLLQKCIKLISNR